MHFPIKLYGGHIPVNQILVISVLTFIAVIIFRLLAQIFPSVSSIYLYLNQSLIKRDVSEELIELEHQILVPNNKTI
jgi:hypothetical protein